jgi:START domain
MRFNLNHFKKLLILVFFFNTSVYGQGSWTLLKEKDGIKISSRPASASQFNDIRVEVDLPGNIDQLKSILLDVGHYKDWSYATKKSVLVKQLAADKLIYYTEIEVPWPATNRYFYANFELKEDSLAHSIQVLAINLPDYMPVPRDLVKVLFTKGIWNISTNSKRSIHVDYMLELNPGGSLPAWVLNLFSTKGPMETFENIKQKMIALNPS